jgi:ATP-dependent RNA helicase DDX5/DBP2
MGFQQDLEHILTQCRPDRQTLMFSATWPKEVQHIAETYSTNQIRVQTGSLELNRGRASFLNP